MVKKKKKIAKKSMPNSKMKTDANMMAMMGHTMAEHKKMMKPSMKGKKK